MKISKILRASLTTCALFVGLAGTAQAGFHIERGDTTGSPTLDVSAIYIDAGTAVPYDIVRFTVDAAGPHQFLLAAAFDSAIFFYADPFDAASPTTNLAAVNNDIFSPDTSGLVAFLVPGHEYTLVISGIDDSQFGTYSLTIGGPGNVSVSAVPEPATWLMLGLGLAAVTVVQRRKTAR